MSGLERAGELPRGPSILPARAGDLPFLHAYADNLGAIGLYERLGFAVRREMVVTVLARP